MSKVIEKVDLVIHIMSNLTYTTSMVSQFIQDSRERHLKSLQIGFLFKRCGSLTIEVYTIVSYK